ncbi:MAG TPA: RsmE family RNA methyltransferase [Candidatus Obscuribacterales bacterium]
MGNRRFFLPREAIDTEAATVSLTDAALVNQLRAVLRLKAGEEILVLDGQGNLYRCLLRTLTKSVGQAEIIAVEKACGDPCVDVTVALPLLKGDRFDWAIQKLTELGAARVVPVISDRTVVKKTSAIKLARWQAIAREAAEQCERATIPQVVVPSALSELVTGSGASQTPPADISFICAERRGAPLLKTMLHNYRIEFGRPQRVRVLVGPEGGFSDREVESASAAGFVPVSLGERILRSETAALLALAVIVCALEE